MLNETNTIFEIVRLTNESNITINVSKVIIESHNTGDIEYLSYFISIIAVIVTGVIAVLNIKANSRNILIQMNQSEIVKNMKTLSEKVYTGDKRQISEFIDSVNGIYIPSSIRKEVQKTLDSEKNDQLSKTNIKYMVKLINEYMTDFKIIAHNIF